MSKKHLTVLRALILVSLILTCQGMAFAHQIALRHQYWWLKGPDVKSWRQDLLSDWSINQSNILIADASHFERFKFEERVLRLGWRHQTTLGHWEFTHADGEDNRILAIRDSQFTYGQALARGISGWLTVKAQGYSTNELHMITAGLEREWSGGLFVIPFLSLGRATFSRPADTRDIWAAQVKVGTYREGRWKLAGFLAQGEEYQALVALNQTTPLKATTYGATADYYLNSFLRTTVLLERIDYPAINTRFESAQLMLTYDWGKP